MPKHIDAAKQQELEGTVNKLRDSKYFRETFFHIVNRDEQTVPFIQNAAQQNYYKEQTDDDLILKARHLGFSSEIEGDFLFRCMTKENTNAVTMAHTMDDTQVHMNRVKYYKKTLGSQAFPIEVTLDTDKATELYLPVKNSYYWIGTAGATGFGRGRQITDFHGSEVSHWKDQAVLTAVLNARSRKARTRLETTANGMGEKFHELWEEAGDPANGSPWKRHFFAWWMDPENVVECPGKLVLTILEAKVKDKVRQVYGVNLTDHQLAWWRRERSRQADKTLMPQEHPSYPREAFLSSGRHVFNLESLEIMENKLRGPDGKIGTPTWVGEARDDGYESRLVENPEGRLSVWVAPKFGRKYIIPADVALGVPGGAFSVATVIDRMSHEICAEWRGRINPGDFGDIMVDIAYWYYNAMLIPENNNDGKATIERIKARRYRHLFKTDLVWKEGERVEDGFPTSDKTKSRIISALQSKLDELSYKENSAIAINEMRNSVWDESGKMVSQIGRAKQTKEERGAHLDTVITRGIGFYCLKFLTLDDTYRDKTGGRGVAVTQAAGGRSTDRTNRGRA